MSNKGRYFTREFDSMVRNPMLSNLNASGYSIFNLGAPTTQDSAVRFRDVSGSTSTNTWYLYPAFADISLNCNAIQDVSSITFCGRQSYIRQTPTTFDISSNCSIRFNNNQLFLQNNGNVGIGTLSPSYNLDITGSTRTKYIIDITASDGNNNSVLIGTTNGIKWTKDLSLNNIEVSNKGTINDLTSINANITNIIANNIDASLNIIDTNINNNYYLTFTEGSGNQKVRIDTQKLIYNPGLNRFGINRDPSYNLDVSGSFRTTTIIDRNESPGINGLLLISTGTGIQWTNDLSLNRLDVSSTTIRDLSATKIWTRDLSSVNATITNLDASSGIISDLSAIRIWTRDLSSVNLQVSNRAIINDLSATKLWTRDLSAINATITNIDVSSGIIRDLSATKIWTIDLSATNLDVSSGIIRDLSSISIYTRDLSAINANITNIITSNIDASLNIIDTNINNNYYLTFTEGSGYQKVRIDTQKLIYNPGLDRFGLNRDPSYNLDVSGSFRTTTIIDRNESPGINGLLLISTGTGIQWTNDLSLNRLDVSSTTIRDLSATKIWTRDLSSVNATITNLDASSGIISDLSAIRIWTRDLSSVNATITNIDVSSGIIRDLSAIRIWTRDLSSVNATITNIDVSSGIIRDLSSTSIRTRDLSAINLTITNFDINNLNVKNIIANNIDGSLNIVNTTNDKLYYLTFSEDVGYQKIRIDTDNLIYNPGLDRLGINRDPSYNLDVSGSFKSTSIFDISNLSGFSGETIISLGNGNGYKWLTPVYGSFSSDLSQNITADPSNIPLTYNHVEIANLCDYTGSKIYVRRSGIFKFLYSIQYTHTLNQDVNVDTYIRINGVNVPRTNSRILLKKDGFIFPVCEYIVHMNKNDYIEVIAYTTAGTVYAFATEAGINPAIPSIISDIYSLVVYP